MPYKQYDIFAAKNRIRNYVTYVTADSPEDAIKQGIAIHKERDPLIAKKYTKKNYFANLIETRVTCECNTFDCVCGAAEAKKGKRKSTLNYTNELIY